MLVGPVLAGDWAHWRGPTENGVSTEKDIPATFEVSEAGKNNLLWTAPYGCRSAPLVLNGRLYFNSHVGHKEKEQERVVCLDASTGKLIWEQRFNVFHTSIVSNRVGWTNLAADPATGNIYCHGTSGLLICFDRDGKILWQTSLTEEFGRVSGYGGRITSPIVDGDLVIIGMACAAWGEYGRGGCRFVAFDKKNGQINWWASTGLRVRDTFQSSPVVANIAGQRLLISGGADGGIHAFKVRTGEKVWSHVFCDGSINVTPVVSGDLVFCAHGGINPDNAAKQGRVICLDASEVTKGEPKVVWKTDGLKISFAAPVLDGNRIIVNDEEAKLHCLDIKNGKVLWKLKYGGGGNVRSSPVLAEKKLYLGDAASRFHVIDVSGKKAEEVHSVALPSTTAGADSEQDGSASIANGCLYFATSETMYCVGKAMPNKPGNGNGVAVKEEVAPEGARPAHLQVVPADVTLGPGASATFTARYFDDKGRFISEAKAEWALGPMLAPEAVPGLPPPPVINPPALKGELTEGGKLTLPKVGPPQFGNVVAKAGGLTAHARVRQYTNLPIKQDFEKLPQGSSPAGWTNSQVKFQVRKVGDTNVLVKTATNPSPLVARAYAFIAPASMTDYTIEADILGKQVAGELPDMAVSANRYTFGLFGETQQLRLNSWDAVPRIDKSIGYPWKADVWYRLKLTVEVKGDKALVRGKIWERGKEEPEKWTVELEDPMPNREGAPALYANVPIGSIGGPMKPGSEIFFDNVAVTPNKQANRGGQAPKNQPQQAAVATESSIIELVPCDTTPARPHLLRRWRR
jgi:outer membrane protein assembly factor BamB